MGIGKGSVRKLFNLFERTVEHKVSGIIIYVYDADKSALKHFNKKNGKVM